MRELASHDANIAKKNTERSDEMDEMDEMARSVAVFRDSALTLMSGQGRLIEQPAEAGRNR